MNDRVMRKLLYATLTLLSLSCALNIEAGTIDRGQRVLRLMMAADTDSLYAEMTTEMQSAIGKMQLKVMWHTLQLTFGKLQSMGEWTEQTTMGYDIAACPLQMERGRLLFSVTFPRKMSSSCWRVSRSTGLPGCFSPGMTRRHKRQRPKLTLPVQTYMKSMNGSNATDIGCRPS